MKLQTRVVSLIAFFTSNHELENWPEYNTINAYKVCTTNPGGLFKLLSTAIFDFFTLFTDSLYNLI